MSLLLVAATACKDDSNDPVDPDPLPPPLPELTKPVNPVVSVKQARMVVVEWEGDETATSYQVELGDRQVELEGTSCGVYVTEDTDYTWRVRALRDEEVTDWVDGPPFRTLVYEDPRNEWTGYWNVDEWDLKVDVSGISVPLDDLMEMLPQELIDAILENLEFKLTTPDEETGLPGYDELLITFDLLEELDLPAIAAIFIDEEKMFSLDQNIDIPLAYPGLPADISEIAFLNSIPQLSTLENIMIEELRVDLSELQLTAGPIEGDRLPFTGVVIGQIVLKTDTAMVDLMIGSLLKPKMRLTLTSTFERSQILAR